MKVILDKREGVRNEDQTYNATQLVEATDIVSKLDGTRHTLAYFRRDDGSSLMVGGGKKHFVVTLTNASQDVTLYNKDAIDGEIIEVCAGGQYDEFPAEIVCTIDQASEAVASFFTGTEADLNWT